MECLGSYCTYCEVPEKTSASLHLEHIKPKSKFPRLAHEWVNFAIACHTCNSVERETRYRALMPCTIRLGMIH